MSPVRLLALTLVAATVAACGRIPLNRAGRVEKGSVIPSEQVYATQCAACHGADGTLGTARPLRDANYLASIGHDRLLDIASRGQGHLMPAMAASQGGPVDDEQLKSLVEFLYAQWGAGGRAGAVEWSGPLGDATRGAAVYGTHCQTCHGAPDGKAPGTRGSVTDPNYLRLVSDQALRSSIVFGRSDLGAGCTGPYPGQPASARLSSADVSDVVAFLASKRPMIGGVKR